MSGAQKLLDLLVASRRRKPFASDGVAENSYQNGYRAALVDAYVAVTGLDEVAVVELVDAELVARFS